MSADVDRYAAERGEACEPEETATRERLGLRPIFYFDDSQHEHPDPNPCPPWCWIVTDNPDNFVHEVDPRTPMKAVHSMFATPEMVASLYSGSRYLDIPGGDATHVGTATFELSATQISTREPLVTVSVRHHGGAGQERRMRLEERLRMTVPDALEMIVALRDVVDRLGGCEPDKERNAFELGRDYERMKSQDGVVASST